jgi:hypothetical protein
MIFRGTRRLRLLHLGRADNSTFGDSTLLGSFSQFIPVNEVGWLQQKRCYVGVLP